MAGVLAWVAQSGVVQGIVIGATLSFLTAILVMNAVARTLTRTVDGWSAVRACGRPDNGVLVRAACAKALPVVNVFEEAAYWTATRDSAGRWLDGGHEYVLHFPPGGLPPNDALWSLTATDVVGYMVDGPTGRHSVDDRSDFLTDADGSVDIRLRRQSPGGRERNWLPVPSGRFKLMLRVYLPGTDILDGTYRVPPVVEVR